ncbi:hypothetical protein [Clostridium estertheticum]|uniref:Uncharacterized protein n=1 Tax=Clostridium estertheticum TaxID=238834 RepID=A0AA47EIK6_9CLOT|nr:hypothetical protein [Clostridium estertheticum]MBU3153481.1 hypothetical protein [Clostridium estertheticum]WAG60883.1 hypothetical protein LL038_01125 [Clostridium estertheticum]
MNKIIIKDLEKTLKEEYSQTTIGDAAVTKMLGIFDRDDMPLENILICLYDMSKINQTKIKKLETNLDTLALRVYNTTDDFTKEEEEQIEFALSMLEIDQLGDIDKYKDYLRDSLYEDYTMKIVSEETDYDKIDELTNELMNKIKYPTQKMAQTFIRLVAVEIINQGCTKTIKQQ